MKRIVALILAVLYLSASVGAVVHDHYCMGHYASSSWAPSQDGHACEHCGMAKKANNGCCKDVQHLLKIKQAHQSASQAFEWQALPAIVPAHPAFDYTASLFTVSAGDDAGLYIPPDAGPVPVFLRNCVFRI